MPIIQGQAGIMRTFESFPRAFDQRNKRQARSAGCGVGRGAVPESTEGSNYGILNWFHPWSDIGGKEIGDRGLEVDRYRTCTWKLKSQRYIHRRPSSLAGRAFGSSRSCIARAVIRRGRAFASVSHLRTSRARSTWVTCWSIQKSTS